MILKEEDVSTASHAAGVLSDYLNSTDFTMYDSVENPLTYMEDLAEDFVLVRRAYASHPDWSKLMDYLVECLQKNEDQLPNNYSFFNGRLKVAYVLLQAYDVCGKESYLSVAKRYIGGSLADYIKSSRNGNGLRKGRGSAVVGIIMCSRLFEQEEINEILSKALEFYLFDLVPQKHGLCNANSESHVGPLTDLADGSAGVLWLLTEINRMELAQNEIRIEMLESLAMHVNGAWDGNTRNWRSNRREIRNLADHQHFMNAYVSGDPDIIQHPSIDLSFWTGTMGILVSLVNYLSTLPEKSGIQESLLDKIVNAEKAISANSHAELLQREVIEFYYGYLVLYHYFGSRQYLDKALSLIKICQHPRKKAVMELCRLLEFDVDVLGVLPSSLPDPKLITLPMQPLNDFKENMLGQNFPNTFRLLNKWDLRALISENLASKSIDEGLIEIFYTRMKTALRKNPDFHKLMIKDCLEFESKRRKFIRNFKNRLLLKCQEIFQRERADLLLSITEEKLDKIRMKISDSIKIVKCGWAWSSRDPQFLTSIVERPKSSVYILIQAKCSRFGSLEFFLTEIELVLLEMFYEPMTSYQALANIRKEFGDLSPEETEALRQTGRHSLDFFIFNRFIIEA